MDYKYSTKNGETQAFLRKAADKNVFSSRSVFQIFFRAISSLSTFCFSPASLSAVFSKTFRLLFIKKKRFSKSKSRKNLSLFQGVSVSGVFPFCPKGLRRFLINFKKAQKSDFSIRLFKRKTSYPPPFLLRKGLEGLFTG